MPMTRTRTAKDVLDRDFLEVRCRLLDIAAALDRIDRAQRPDSVRGDLRLAKLQEAIRVLIDGKPDRAERVQMVFSDSYDEGWQTR